MLDVINSEDTNAMNEPSRGRGNRDSLSLSSLTEPLAGDISEPRSPSPGQGRPWTPYDNADPMMHENNIRVNRRTAGSTAPTPRSVTSVLSSRHKDSDDEEEEEEVFNRAQLKKSSRKRANIANMKKEQERRRKKQLEQLKNGEMPKGKLLKQHQAEADARRMGNKRPKDKSAFLTERPDLL